MKKLTILILAICFGLSGFAQTKSGTVYSEHECIDKTKKFWKAFTELNKEDLTGLLADTIYNYNNGVLSTSTNDQWANILNWYTSIENFRVKDNHPATPDAIEYKDGTVWVHDWLHTYGIHKQSGIPFEFPFHMSYCFDKEGKIFVIMWNYDNDVIEEINNSNSKMENGSIFINHPYINTARKVVNAYQNMDIESWEEFFTPNARFFLSDRQFDETIDIETRKNSLKLSFAKWTKLKMIPHGHPDCLHYAKGDQFVVYSWWTLSAVEQGGKQIKVPLMLVHHFTKEGKIWGEDIYFSSNHLE